MHVKKILLHGTIRLVKADTQHAHTYWHNLSKGLGSLLYLFFTSMLCSVQQSVGKEQLLLQQSMGKEQLLL